MPPILSVMRKKIALRYSRNFEVRDKRWRLSDLCYILIASKYHERMHDYFW